MEMEGLENMTLEQLLAQYEEKEEKAKVPKIRSLNKELGYLEARKVAEPYGGLPRNVTHKRTLVDSDDWKGLTNYYPAWAREILVYPKPNGTFRKGDNVVDAYRDEKRRKWVYPSFCVPYEAIGKRNVALFVTPMAIVEEKHKVIVIAAPNNGVVVLSDFPQNSGWRNVDENTGIPLSAKNVDTSSSSAGYLWRQDGAGVRPLVRGYDGYGGCGDWRDVGAFSGYGSGFGVGVESLEVVPQNLESLTLGQLLSAVKKE